MLTLAQKEFIEARDFATRGLQMLINNFDIMEEVTGDRFKPECVFEEIVTRAFFKNRKQAQQGMSKLWELVSTWVDENGIHPSEEKQSNGNNNQQD